MKLKNKGEDFFTLGAFVLITLGGTLGASLLGNLLTGAKGIMHAGDGIVRAGSGSKKKT